MGTGKSSVGRLVADSLHFQFVDTDEWIEARAGKTIPEIFAGEGEVVFREHERRVVQELQTLQQTVIATGGGLGANAENIASLKQHALVVCLWASAPAIWNRVKTQAHRPLLHTPDPQGKIRDLLELREPFYRSADILVNTEVRSVKEVAQHVVHEFHLAKECR